MRHSGHWEDSEAHSTERRELRCGCGLRDDIVSCHPREELGHSLGRVVAVGVGGGALAEPVLDPSALVAFWSACFWIWIYLHVRSLTIAFS